MYHVGGGAVRRCFGRFHLGRGNSWDFGFYLFCFLRTAQTKTRLKKRGVETVKIRLKKRRLPHQSEDQGHDHKTRLDGRRPPAPKRGVRTIKICLKKRSLSHHRRTRTRSQNMPGWAETLSFSSILGWGECLGWGVNFRQQFFKESALLPQSSLLDADLFRWCRRLRERGRTSLKYYSNFFKNLRYFHIAAS